MAVQGASSSSFRITPRWPYDVFLSCKDEDFAESFTDRLQQALCQKGFATNMDDRKLRRGEDASPAVLKAIKESRISIVVISENYASSTRCLVELMEILHCRETKHLIVLPVFYEVDPSDVRQQRKSFGDALAKHEEMFREEVVRSWKAALNKVANLAGWHLEDGSRNESKFIHKIVEAVSRIVSRTYLKIPKHPIGIESRIQDINVLLEIGMSDIRTVGIFGVGGVGKTTIAKVVYNSVAYQFQHSCFLANIRENSKQEGGRVQLQETLLSEILGNSCLKVGNVHRGINVIKERLHCRRVLLVLDDVDELVQLETLCGDLGWFGVGSRIIITTRDEHLLIKHKVDLRYKMNELDHDKALQLFSRHAFQNDKPNDGFVELTRHILHYAGALPLALVVLGSNLYGRDIHYWKSTLEKYKTIPEKGILEILRISYEGLEESEKNIFLDIACFFKGSDETYVNRILDICGFFPTIGIKVLMDKSLINIDESNKLVMHDLLQDLGKDIVYQESPKEPGKRSRLWFHEDIRHVLEENTGTNKIEGILIKLPEPDLIHLSSTAFTKMKMLRLFINRNGCFSRAPSYLSNELRLLDWAECPLQSFPSNFHGKKLVVCKINNGLFKEPKKVFKNFQNLSIMTFSNCKFLAKIPDVSGIPNLEEFNVAGCSNLVEIHDSLGFLEKLSYLSARSCPNLIRLPGRLRLRSLEMLFLEGCSSLQYFPEIEIKMEHVRDITLNGAAIRELPSSIGNLTGLRQLYLRGCRNLMYLPDSILQLQHLENLSLESCSELVKFPTKVRDGALETSTELSMNSRVLKDGCSLIGLPALTNLELENFPLSRSNLLETLDCFSSLEHLFLAGTDIVSLPPCIKRFVGLKSLRLDDCKNLQEIVELPPNVEEISASGCVSLESFPEVSKKFQYNTCGLKALDWIDLAGCHKMPVNIGNHVVHPSWNEGHLKGCSGGIIFPGNRIPDWFSHRNETVNSKLCEIDITGHLFLEDIKGIAFSAVMGTIHAISPYDPVAYIATKIISTDVGIELDGRLFNSMRSDHVWLEYFVLEPSQLRGDNLRVRFSTRSDSVLFKSCGVHLIQKQEENPEDYPGMLHEEVHDDKEIDNSVDLMDGIQLSKRHRDDDDDDDDVHNLESCHPQQKRHSSTFSDLG